MDVDSNLFGMSDDTATRQDLSASFSDKGSESSEIGQESNGISTEKETVAKTEPQQPNNAVSTGSSLSADGVSGISGAEPNGEPTVSDGKGNESSGNEQRA